MVVRRHILAIQSGHVALDVHLPGSGLVTVDSIGIGDLPAAPGRPA